MEKPRGHLIIKIVAFVMLVFGLLSLISGFTYAFASKADILKAINATQIALSLGELRMYGYITLVIGAYMFVSGLVGIRFANEKSKAKVIMIVGIIYLVIVAFNIALETMNTGSFNPMTLLPAALPLLYIAGAVMNKNS